MNRCLRSSWGMRLGVHAAAVVAALSVVALPAAQAQPGVDHHAPAVEATYQQPGPWKVAKRVGADCCSSTGEAYDIWYPADLGARSTRHPTITWGNGTFAHPREYDFLLSHLASWGFVIIAPDLTNTGTGTQMLDAVKYLDRQNGSPASIFHGKLDLRSVGAAGHSQGATGAINATMLSRGAITTAVTVELPSLSICPACAAPPKLTAGSVLMLSGSVDPISNAQTERVYYDALPATLPKARATLIGANHNDIQGQPGCSSMFCTEGVNGYLGYLTAWFMDRLRGDAFARGAFVSGIGELARNTARWTSQASTVR